jgi:hypothetical protein
MTARPEDQPLPADEGNAERIGRPERGKADDGKSGGISQGGKTSQGMGTGTGSPGTNAQRGGESGSENERNAPGMSTEKKADDTK